MDKPRALRLIEQARNHTIPDTVQRWLAVGCLAEAADECLPDHQEAAEELRLERLVLMDDIANYTPDYTTLIERVKSLK